MLYYSSKLMYILAPPISFINNLNYYCITSATAALYKYLCYLYLCYQQYLFKNKNVSIFTHILHILHVQPLRECAYPLILAEGMLLRLV